MKIEWTEYDQNKLKTYEALACHFNELAGISEQTIGVNNPYTPTRDKLSLEAIADGAVVGRLVGSYDSNTNSVRIDALFVDRERRGQNIGAQLMDAFEQDAIKKNVSVAFVDTVKSSAPAFYERLGYGLVGEIQAYPTPDETYYLYMKRLPSQ